MVECEYFNFDSETLDSVALNIWELVPDTNKNEKSLSSFKGQIKT